jgi:mRNA-degrading endonuclease RelE of RelBE toxin-antitoxin system
MYELEYSKTAIKKLRKIPQNLVNYYSGVKH